MQQNNQKQLNAIKGFTLIEIMVVVVILAILATFVLPNFLDRPDQARISKAKQDIRALEGALQLYRLDNFVYPTTEQGLNALVVKPETAGQYWKRYIDRLPRDPWDNDYQYLNPGSHGGALDIFSYGADGAEGGLDVNADIGNWNEDKNKTNNNANTNK